MQILLPSNYLKLYIISSFLFWQLYITNLHPPYTSRSFSCAALISPPAPFTIRFAKCKTPSHFFCFMRHSSILRQNLSKYSDFTSSLFCPHLQNELNRILVLVSETSIVSFEGLNLIKRHSKRFIFVIYKSPFSFLQQQYIDPSSNST